MQDIKRLEMLLELRRLGTITAVARSLSYSTSAVSQQIAALEREFSAVLLVPDGRRVRLTPQAEVLADHAERILDAWAETQAAVSGAISQPAGKVRVAGFQTACLALLPKLVASVKSAHPLVSINLVQAETDVAIPLLLAREVDFAVIETYPDDSENLPLGVVNHVLFKDRMWLAVQADRQPHQELRLTDLAETSWVFETAGSPAHAWATRACRAAGFEPRVEHLTSDVVVQHQLVREGVAAAFLPDLTPAYLQAGVRLEALDPSARREVSAVMRDSRAEHPTLDVVLELLSKSAPTLGVGCPTEPASE